VLTFRTAWPATFTFFAAVRDTEIAASRTTDTAPMSRNKLRTSGLIARSLVKCDIANQVLFIYGTEKKLSKDKDSKKAKASDTVTPAGR
jgi:hypothetical protein